MGRHPAQFAESRYCALAALMGVARMGQLGERKSLVFRNSTTTSPTSPQAQLYGTGLSVNLFSVPKIYYEDAQSVILNIANYPATPDTVTPEATQWAGQ